MKPAALFLIVIAVAAVALATAQAPDILNYQGETYYIHSNPLTPFLRSAKVQLPKPGVVSTGLWRGYIATWSIRDNQLYLDDVRIPTRAYMDSDAPEEKQFRSAMKHIFRSAEPKVATWFTGYLIVPTGCDVSTGCSVVGVAHPGDFGDSESVTKQIVEGGPGGHSQECSTHAAESSATGPARTRRGVDGR